MTLQHIMQVALGAALGSLAAYGVLCFLATEEGVNLFRYQGF
jgi:hypothetical protein